MMEDIKSCPFCGRAGEAISEGNKYWYVACTNSSCPMGCVSTYTYDNLEQAIKAWNTRQEIWPECTMIMYEGDPSCSLCHGELDYDAQFCEWCGAHVVRDDAE